MSGEKSFKLKVEGIPKTVSLYLARQQQTEKYSQILQVVRFIESNLCMNISAMADEKLDDFFVTKIDRR